MSQLIYHTHLISAKSSKIVELAGISGVVFRILKAFSGSQHRQVVVLAPGNAYFWNCIVHPRDAFQQHA